MEKESDKKERLSAVCQGITANYPRLMNALEAGTTNERFLSMTLWGHYESFALKAFFIDEDVAKAKRYFYNCGLRDVFLTARYDEKILDFGINHLSYALLSDNETLIREYANLRHSNYEAMIQNGRSTPMFALQCLIKEDWSEFERAMAIINTKTIRKLGMALDAEFYTALAEKNKEKIQQVIEELVSPKVHKKRNVHHILKNEFISHPAIGYAKLAWLKGIEVEIRSPLIPRELLEVAPLAVYEEIDLNETLS
ncbi:Imm49 family immunity protein [Chitinophaga niabensis]|uniref:Immunity protein 49 n=1 Tax=Chitinophaga niabensis TaxID=536979 RepID=A0A1N6K0X7_9BACT|nr:Imm49 family immunity protein [Chitinophaga niabensis]SIO50123.1 Immunity protein 49 [Chitinophaga niabensis]